MQNKENVTLRRQIIRMVINHLNQIPPPRVMKDKAIRCLAEEDRVRSLRQSISVRRIQKKKSN